MKNYFELKKLYKESPEIVGKAMDCFEEFLENGQQMYEWNKIRYNIENTNYIFIFLDNDNLEYDIITAKDYSEAEHIADNYCEDNALLKKYILWSEDDFECVQKWQIKGAVHKELGAYEND